MKARMSMSPGATSFPRYAGGADPFLGLTDGTFGNQEIADNIEVARRIDDPGIG
jgi:hypothetical protein